MEGQPSLSDIEVLWKMAAGFFTYASTGIKFIASQNDPLNEQHALVTSLPQNTTKEGNSGVDQPYIKVLEQAFCDVQEDNSQCYPHFQAVVGTILFISNPL